MTSNTKLPEAVAAGKQNKKFLIDDCVEGATPAILNNYSHLAHCHSALSVMKSFFKFPAMLLLLGFFLCTDNLLKAGTPLCEDPCPAGPKQWVSIVLPCKVSYNDSSYPGNPPVTAPYITVEIAFRLRPCDNSIIIEDYVFLNDADYYLGVPWLSNISFAPCAYSTIIPGPPQTTISTQTQIEQGVKDAIEHLRDSLGNPSAGNFNLYFKGSCRSYVGLSFPQGSFYTQWKDIVGGGTYLDTVYLSPNSIVVQGIPCDSGCCKVSYEWIVDSIFNGETYSSWHAVSSATSTGDCATKPLPDYNLYPNKIEAQMPGGGTVTGTVVSQSPCKPMCSQFFMPPPTNPATSVESDILSKDQALQLSAAPLPFGNYIRLSSNKNIRNALAVIYDINGKKVLNAGCLENGELNTSKLKKGVYFIQVWFPDNTLKTIKAIKQ